MKIAVNTRFLLKDKLEGIGWFTHESLKRMVLNHPEHEFHFLFDRAYDESFIYADNVVPHVLFPPARHPFLWYTWFEWSVPRALKKIKPDLFLSTDSYASLRTKFPQVVVIHDIAFEHRKEDVGGLVGKYYRYFTPRYAKKVNRIATVSTHSKNDIAATYGIDQSKIDVVFNGANEGFVPLDDQGKLEVKQKFSEGEDYFLFVGAQHPRKNVGNLFRAFDQFKEQTGSKTKLLMVGRKAWGTEDMETAFNNMKYKSEVIFTGRVSAEDLGRILGGSKAQTYIPFYEGFGIPILESHYCHVPVITSNTSSMPEVVGEGGIQVDPYDQDSIVKALIEIDSNEELYHDLVKKAAQNKGRFSWNQTSDKLWECCMKVLNQ